MSTPPVTRASLLVRLRDPGDAVAWSEFVELYAPLVYGFARKRGLQDADAADLMQEVLRAVARAIGRLEYDSRKGTFRAWLFTISRNKVFSFLDAQRRQVRGTGDTGVANRLGETPAPEDESLWDQEYERRLFAVAIEKVKPEFQPTTWQAFWQTAVDNREPKAVAAGLKMSVGAVYVAKSRVMARLREEVRALQEA